MATPTIIWTGYNSRLALIINTDDVSPDELYEAETKAMHHDCQHTEILSRDEARKLAAELLKAAA
jgi:hypothetical protein